MLSLISLLLASATASASATSLQTGAERRRQLLESYLHGPVQRPQPIALDIKLAQARLKSESPPPANLRSLQQANVTSAQSLAAQDEPEAAKRPLTMAFYNRLDDTRSKTEQDYIMNTLVPATAAVLRRSMRVRDPTGPLPLVGFKDEAGLAIPPPPNGTGTAAADGDAPAGYDADILMKVTSMPATAPECDGLLAGAAAHLLENTSRRPVFGYVIFCNVDPSDYHNDLATAVHEILHALAMDPALFESYPGYAATSDVLRTDEDGRTTIRTPQVAHKARAHLGCDGLAGAELEDDGVEGTAGSHWEQRIFEGEIMDSVGGWGDSHHFRHSLTDLTLALLQDSGWYDVKYGSAGFNSFGYKAGCEFALGTYKEAMAVPAAKQYLCPAAMDKRYVCLHDFAGDGVCHGDKHWDGFYRALPSSSESVDCQGVDRGTRCLKKKADRWPECVPMSCSDSGKVLVNGKPCNPKTMDCPPEEAMCDEPGHLTCVDTLNDCSGKGDCFRGNCYCHSGWGGADCSEPMCIGTCTDGSACPPSGFCGVPDCGSWSRGAGDRGIACFSARDANLPHSMTPARPVPPGSVPPTVVAPIGVVLPATPDPAPAPAPVLTPAPAPAPAVAVAVAPTPTPAAVPTPTPAAPAAPPSPTTSVPVFIFPSPEPLPTPTTPGPAVQQPPANPAASNPATETDTATSTGTAGEPEAPIVEMGENVGVRGFNVDGGIGEADSEEDEGPETGTQDEAASADGGAAVEGAPAANDAACTLRVLCPLAFLAMAVALVGL